MQKLRNAHGEGASFDPPSPAKKGRNVAPSTGAPDYSHPKLVPNPEVAATGSDITPKDMRRRTFELVVIDKICKRRVVCRSSNPSRAAEFRAAQHEWEAHVARRQAERQNAADPLNVRTRQLLAKTKKGPIKAG